MKTQGINFEIHLFWMGFSFNSPFTPGIMLRCLFFRGERGKSPPVMMPDKEVQENPWSEVSNLERIKVRSSKREVGEGLWRLRCLQNTDKRCISLIIYWASYIFISSNETTWNSESADRFSWRSSFTESSTSFKVTMWEYYQYLQILKTWMCRWTGPNWTKFSQDV